MNEWLRPFSLALLVSAGAAAAPDMGARMVRTEHSVRLMLARGEYGRAEHEAARVVSRLALSPERGSLAEADAIDLLVEAKIRSGRVADGGVVRLAERAADLKARLSGREALALAVSLHNLGSLHRERGDFGLAVPLLERALAIRRLRLSPADPRLADSLEVLAASEIMLERYALAGPRLDRARAIREAASGGGPLALARTLELQGVLAVQQGAYDAALTLLDRAMALREQGAPGHPATVSLLIARGNLLFLRSDMRGAQREWQAARALSARTLRRDHPHVPEIIRKLAAAADVLGDRTEARRLLADAVALGSRALPPCHPEVVWLMNDQALFKVRDALYDEARQLFRDGVNAVERCGGSADAIATAVHNEAIAAAEMGAFGDAERLHQRAIAIWSGRVGADHPRVARALDAFADLLAMRGQAARARALYEEALRLRRRSATSDRPDIAWTLTNLARTMADMGEATQALAYVSQAIDIYRRAGAFDEPDHFARALELRGTLEAREGRFASARSSLRDALTERERAFGVAHPLATATRATLAAIDFALGARTPALTAAIAAEGAWRTHARYSIRYLPERQALAFAARRPAALDLALSALAAGRSRAAGQVADAVLQSRGLVLDELAARARRFDDASPADDAAYAAALAARQRFANLLIRSLDEPVPRAVIDEAREDKERAERTLAERSVEAQAELARTAAGLADVRRAMPPDAVLVSYVHYRRLTADAPGARWPLAPVQSYAAFVVRPGARNVTFVPLGSASPIDAAVQVWRTHAADPRAGGAGERDAAYRRAAERLRARVWDPVAAHVGDAARVFLVPDGLLNVVNFAALPARDGGFMVEGDAVLHYLSTERDLVANGGAAPFTSLLAVGGPAFDAVVVGSPDAEVLRGGACDAFRRAPFRDLSGARREALDIAELWPSASGATILSGVAATEAAVKHNLARRRLIHFATHAFVVGRECVPAAEATRAVGRLVPAAPQAASPDGENPLPLAGLALAGANQRASAGPDGDDGILTAEEIAGLNLQGTEWAVLSACDTGLGEIRAGEGVFGLRRAFQIAGARTVIMSLWSVDDEATRTWMRELYEGRLRHGLATADAVREASLRVLQARRSAGQSTHPFYWAAFVAAGDWR